MDAITTATDATVAAGALIRKAREARRLTVEQLAAAAGVSRSTLSIAERGAGNVTLRMVNKILAAMELDLHLEVEPTWEKIDQAIDDAVGRSLADRIQQWDPDLTAFVSRFHDLPYLVDGLTAAALQGAPVPVPAFEMAVPLDDDVLSRLTFELLDMGAKRWNDYHQEWGFVSVDPREDQEEGFRWQCLHGEVRVRLVDGISPSVWVETGKLPAPRMSLTSLANMFDGPRVSAVAEARLAVVPLVEIETTDDYARRVLERMRSRLEGE